MNSIIVHNKLFKKFNYFTFIDRKVSTHTFFQQII